MKSSTLYAFAVNAGLVTAALLSVWPLAWMLSVSFMQPGEASSFPPPVFPSAFTLDNYQALFGKTGMGRSFLNSAFLAVSSTCLSLCFNVTAGYAFAKLKFYGREQVFRVLLGALVIPGQVAMIPLFLLLKELGLVNTYAGVLIPSLASVFGIFLVRQYASSIPDELLEAARIDGAGEWRTFLSIVLPTLRPIVVTLALFTFLGSWNDFFWPLVVLTDDDLRTLPVALAALSREHVQDRELMMAGSVITVLPVLVLFLCLQRYYLQGIFSGSVKG